MSTNDLWVHYQTIFKQFLLECKVEIDRNLYIQNVEKTEFAENSPFVTDKLFNCKKLVEVNINFFILSLLSG
jgi:hypothetical protein